MTPKTLYQTIMVLSLFLTAGALGAVIAYPGNWQAFSAAVAGAFASLFISAWFQALASEDLSRMVTRTNFSLKGVTSVPDDFFNMRWSAHVTLVDDKMGKLTPAVHISKLIRVRSMGKDIVEYDLEAESPGAGTVHYFCTFVGLNGCVLGILGNERDYTSVFSLDTPVGGAGAYFGAGYITSWAGTRIVSFQIFSTSEVPETFLDIPQSVREPFRRWLAARQIHSAEIYNVFDKQFHQ